MIKKLTKKEIKNIEVKLEDVQKRCTTNTFNIDEVVETSKIGANIINKISEFTRENFEKEAKCRIYMAQGGSCGGWSLATTAIYISIKDEKMVCEITREKTAKNTTRVEILNFDNFTIEEKREIKSKFNATNYGNIEL